MSSLTGAYMEALIPGEKSTDGTNPERAVKAVRDSIKEIEYKAKAAAEPAPAESAKPAPAPQRSSAK